MNFLKCLNVVILSITHELIDDETDLVKLFFLFFKTTDENWKPCVVKEAVNQIFKVNPLSILFNCPDVIIF